MNNWSVYMVRCRDSSLYTGITTDLDRRFSEHCEQGNKCAKYLKGKAPLQLVYQATIGTRAEASREECRIKKLTKSQKECLLESSSNQK